MRSALQPGGALGPFRYRAFRAIWIANMASSIGSVIQAVAAAWAMTGLTSSHLPVALVQASATIPILLFGTVAGALADAFDRRIVMLVAQAGMLVVSAVLALVGYAGWLNPANLLALTLLVGIGTALNGPAWQASVRLQVERAELPQAISLNAISFNIARSVGPALGGLILSLWSVSLAFAINAVSYLAMIVVLLRWHPVVPPPPPHRQPIGAAIGEGLAYCLRAHAIRKVLLRGLLFGFGAASFQALLPVLVRQQIHGTEIAYGLMLGAFGTGSISAALWVSGLRRRFGSEAVVSAGTVAFVAALLLLAQSRTPSSGLAGGLMAALLGGTGWIMAMTSLNVAIQLRAPEPLLARCLSVYQSVTFGGMALGAWGWGNLADRLGTPDALRCGALWMAASLLLRLFAPMPTRAEGRLEPGENAHGNR